MNDVLPKPFTKEGLLNMLEKHLGHLKKLPDGMEAVQPQTASSMPRSSTTQSIKDDSSPGQSPSTISNWQSPGQFSGISPTVTSASSQYMQPHTPTGYGIEHGMQFPPPATPLGAPPPRIAPGHRRQISDMSGGDDLANDPKRQRLYAQPNAAIMGQMQRGRAS